MTILEPLKGIINHSIMTRRDALLAIGGITGMIFAKRLIAADKQYDGITSATANTNSISGSGDASSRVLLVLVSFHHKNTAKIAIEIAKALNAQIKVPQQINIGDLQKYDLIGFGSGIYDQKHHRSILELIDKLPNDAKRKTFIFSTSGVSRKTCLKHSIDDPHAVIREKLQSKDYKIMGEYNCIGWNTNSFLKLFGGINKGKPNTEDLKQAKEFAESMQHLLS